MQDTLIRSSLQRRDYCSAWQEFMNAIELLVDDTEQTDRLTQLWIDHVAGRHVDEAAHDSNSAFLLWDYAKNLVEIGNEMAPDEETSLDKAERILIKAVTRLWPRPRINYQRNQALCLL